MKTCLHSVSYSGTWGGQTALTLKQFIEKASRLGFESVEFAAKRPHCSPLDLDKEQRQEIKQLLEEKGLELACIASYHDFSAFFEHKDMAYMEKELLYMKSIIELASDLGCSLVRTYTGYFKEGIPYRSQWDACVKGIKESAQMAAPYGITIGVQNHSCIASDPESLLDFMAEVNEPNAKVVLDAPFIDNHFRPMRETVLQFKGMIVHTHLTDYIRREKYKYVSETVTFDKNGIEMISIPIGKGSINYEEFIAALHEVGYQGSLSYEMCSPLVGGGSEANLDRSALESLDYVKQILNGL
ncbi:sugar phosphate isomerase/epimerase family protein [Paenibacillus aceris]|uniref:Sugar phosphate isomerase/epimerase n=1 Tax=Paenibacillus aceris TaxID=869555 RepID=A0ABS4I698_9BACL|nr:sugar phosphate isomerase/epimerase family protein [Paenibacillus aceris]MBP1966434.1 sugar phosphate isomerase/epimerase [Paenibacillus aceris]NHW39584.1 sugar phosphate isomerase/epimerase [Paenibacillus aceris]